MLAGLLLLWESTSLCQMGLESPPLGGKEAKHRALFAFLGVDLSTGCFLRVLWLHRGQRWERRWHHILLLNLLAVLLSPLSPRVAALQPGAELLLPWLLGAGLALFRCVEQSQVPKPPRFPGKPIVAFRPILINELN